MRLRQIALVGADLAARTADIEAVLGVSHPYDDPGVGHYGLRNGVWAVGQTFLEVVSPRQPGTTAGRLIEKRGGDGGYMVILQVRDLAAARRCAAEAGARVVEQIDRPGVAATHYHPRDVGGAILSLDWMDPWDRWEWGGKGWEGNARPGQAIVGAELQAEDPAAMAGRWGEVLGRPVEQSDGARRIALEGGEIRFTPLGDERGEGLSGFDVVLADPTAARSIAESRGLIDADGEVVLCGARIYLRRP
ncbi:MAG: hypothetical protein JWR84_3780 [Caulobacter sp.]|nr:hypothetical protein [Caulobacter sp.]